MMNAKILHIRGAYGRTATLKDWADGKDFQILNGPYMSIRDMERIQADGYDYIQALAGNGTFPFCVQVRTEMTCEGSWLVAYFGPFPADRPAPKA